MSQNVGIPAYGDQQTVGAVQTTYPFAPNTDVANVVSATAAVVATGGTITTAGVTVARVNPGAAVTGVILEAGSLDGQVCTVVNTSASADSVTFAAAATSNVASGTSAVIAGVTGQMFVWSEAAALWFAV